MLSLSGSAGSRPPKRGQAKDGGGKVQLKLSSPEKPGNQSPWGVPLMQASMSKAVAAETVSTVAVMWAPGADRKATASSIKLSRGNTDPA
jgi:hypothetical protein